MSVDGVVGVNDRGRDATPLGHRMTVGLRPLPDCRRLLAFSGGLSCTGGGAHAPGEVLERWAYPQSSSEGRKGGLGRGGEVGVRFSARLPLYFWVGGAALLVT